MDKIRNIDERNIITMNYHRQLPAYCDYDDHQAYDSDEDTEDASESELPHYEYTYNEYDYTEIKDQMYLDKLQNLKDQLMQLEDGIHPEFVKQLKIVEAVHQDRLLLNQVFKAYEEERVEREFINEKSAAFKEYEDRTIELRENLIVDLEDRRKTVESERTSLELLSDSAEPKPVTTRKLRRRPNEPIPVPDKRRRTSPAQLNHQLDDKDINDDLRAIQKATNCKQSINQSVKKFPLKSKST